MNTRMLRSLPVALALVLAIAGVALAAGLTTSGPDDALPAASDDDGTPDQGSGDAPGTDGADDPDDPAMDDDPTDPAGEIQARTETRTRTEIRTDDTRTRVETRERDDRTETRVRERTEEGETRIREETRTDDDDRGEAEDRGLRTEIRERDDRIELRQELAFAGGTEVFSVTFQGAVVGTVTVHRDAAALELGPVTAEAGWTAHIKQDSGREVEVSFRDAMGQRAEFEAEIQNDLVVKVRFRERLG